jgi:hypothetical protein
LYSTVTRAFADPVHVTGVFPMNRLSISTDAPGGVDVNVVIDVVLAGAAACALAARTTGAEAGVGAEGVA